MNWFWIIKWEELNLLGGDLGRSVGNGEAEMWRKACVCVRVGSSGRTAPAEKGNGWETLDGGAFTTQIFIIQLQLISISAMSTSFQTISEAVLGTWGKPKDRAVFHLWIVQTRKRSDSRAGESKWARAKPLWANQEPEATETSEYLQWAGGRGSHFLEVNRRGLQSIWFESQRRK